MDAHQLHVSSFVAAFSLVFRTYSITFGLHLFFPFLPFGINVRRLDLSKFVQFQRKTYICETTFFGVAFVLHLFFICSQLVRHLWTRPGSPKNRTVDARFAFHRWRRSSEKGRHESRRSPSSATRMSSMMEKSATCCRRRRRGFLSLFSLFSFFSRRRPVKRRPFPLAEGFVSRRPSLIEIEKWENVLSPIAH